MTNPRSITDTQRARRIRKHAKSLLDLLSDAKPDTELFYVEGFVAELLAKVGKVAAIWSIEDVKGLRPDLTDEQACEVLEEVGRKHDAEWGITWTTLQTVADDMFPETGTDGGRP